MKVCALHCFSICSISAASGDWVVHPPTFEFASLSYTRKIPLGFDSNPNLYHRNADAQAELDKWGITFDKQLLNLTGRVLQPERIFQGQKSVWLYGVYLFHLEYISIIYAHNHN